MAISRAEIRPGVKEGRNFVVREEGRGPNFGEIIENPQEVISLLARVDKELPVRVGGMTLGPAHLEALVDQLARSLGSGMVGRRIEKLERTLPPELEALARWFGGQLGKLETPDGKPLFPKDRLYSAAVLFLNNLPHLAHTPVEFVPKPAPKEGVLTEKVLEEAMVFELLCEKPGSVVRQLLNPVGLSSRGLVIFPKANDLEVDFTIPSALLEILKTLKHHESEQVLRQWILAQCSSKNPEGAINFLKTLVNFSAFLDSPTHLELFKPPEVPGRNPEEIIFQPFRALLNSVGYARTKLFQVNSRQEIVGKLEEVEDLIRLRYAEVYSGRHRTSLYTVSTEALTPTPETFAQWAFWMVKNHLGNGENFVEVASALVRLAESLGIKEVNPLIGKLVFQPDLQKAFLEEAKRAGLIPDPEAVPKAIKALQKKPLHDAERVNFAEIIGRETTDLEIYVFTGTFGPFTKGHKDLVQKLLFYINSLPQEQGWDERTQRFSQRFQRMVLIAPLTNVANIAEYRKSPAQVGSVEIRVSSILLQLAGTVDPGRVFITTALQPDTARTDSLEVSARDTVRRLEGKIQKDLARSGRVAGFNSVMKFIFGPDEIRWWGSPRVIAPKKEQREKVTWPGGVCVSRSGWQSAILRELSRLPEMTGVEVVILTPGTPHSSSSRLIEGIDTTGSTQAVEAGARDFVVRHWCPEAIRERQNKHYPEALSPEVPSVDEIRRRLIEELTAGLG